MALTLTLTLTAQKASLEDKLRQIKGSQKIDAPARVSKPSSSSLSQWSPNQPDSIMMDVRGYSMDNERLAHELLLNPAFELYSSSSSSNAGGDGDDNVESLMARWGGGGGSNNKRKYDGGMSVGYTSTSSGEVVCIRMVRARVKDVMERAFWDSLLDDLCQKPCPMYTRVLNVLDEIRRSLVLLGEDCFALSERVAFSELVNGIIDMQIITQCIQNDAFKYQVSVLTMLFLFCTAIFYCFDAGLHRVDRVHRAAPHRWPPRPDEVRSEQEGNHREVGSAAGQHDVVCTTD
jgi:hypothetical protein